MNRICALLFLACIVLPATSKADGCPEGTTWGCWPKPGTYGSCACMPGLNNPDAMGQFRVSTEKSAVPHNQGQSVLFK